jgi:hypothetical protein
MSKVWLVTGSASGLLGRSPEVTQPCYLEMTRPRSRTRRPRQNGELPLAFSWL